MKKETKKPKFNRKAVLGVKERYATYIRKRLLKWVKGIAKDEGIPITRVFENALILYVGVHWYGVEFLDSFNGTEEYNLRIEEACDEVGLHLDRDAR